MTGDLMQYANGGKVEKHDRQVAGHAKGTHDRVRHAAFKADGALALAGHIMEGAVQLDQRRRQLAGKDQIANAILVEIEQEALRQVQLIQANLYNPWF